MSDRNLSVMKPKSDTAGTGMYSGDLDATIARGVERLPQVPPVEDRVVWIGDVAIHGHLVLAPMSGVCDHPFRWLCRKAGASMVCGEFVSSDGLARGNEKTHNMLAFTEDERPISVQIFGSDPDVIGEATRFVEAAGVDIVDLNFGCPVKKVTKREAGSALLRNPDLLGRIVRAAVDAADRAPVTAKIRSGWETTNACEIARIVEDNGAAAIAVHGRTQKMGYTGDADWDVIRRVKETVSIPVIGNGDIFNPSDVFRMLDTTGCDLVMSGRGAQGAPWLFAETNAVARGEVVETVPWTHRIEIAAAHLALMLKMRPESAGVRMFRTHMSYYTKSIPGSATFRREAFVMSEADAVFQRLREFAEELENEIIAPEVV
jgi:tRNA-dihydrouridine synthase B